MTASLASGSGPLGGTIKATAVGGIVTFTNLVDDTAEAISLQFSGDGLSSGPSTSIIVSPAAAFRLAIHAQPSSTAIAGQPFATQPVVYEVDQFGNVETGDNATLLIASLATGIGPLQGTTSITLSGGIGTYANLANNSAGTMSLVFSGGGLSAGPSNNVNVSPGPASQLVIHTPPDSSVVAGSPLTDPIVIDEEDQYHNIETGDDSTVVTVSLASGVGPLQGTSTATVSGGIATFTNLGDDTAETITLKFSSGNLTAPTSAGIVVSPAAASKLVVTQQPSAAATAGASFITQPVVKEEDPFGNVITSDSTHTVTVAHGTLGTAALQGSNLTVTLSSGVATFSGLSYDKAETMNLGFITNANNVSTASSNTIAVSPAAINQLVINQQPSATASTGQLFAIQPVIFEEDQFNNLESGDNTTVIAAMLNGGAGPLQGTTTATVSGGVRPLQQSGRQHRRDGHAQVHQRQPGLATVEFDHRQPGTGREARDPHRAVVDSHSRPRIRDPARDLSRRCQRQSRDERQHHGGDSVARRRQRPARRYGHGHGCRRYRDLHEPR